MRELLKRELARVLRTVAEHLDHEQRLSPEAEKALAEGIASAKAGHVAPVDLGSFKKYADDDREEREASPKPPVFVPVPYPVPEPMRVYPQPWQPWPGYPQPYIGDPPLPSPPWVITYGDPVTASAGTACAPFVTNN